MVVLVTSDLALARLRPTHWEAEKKGSVEKDVNWESCHVKISPISTETCLPQDLVSLLGGVLHFFFFLYTDT